MYLIANLGAGPRDGLMTGLQKKTKAPIALVRVGIEIVVVLLGMVFRWHSGNWNFIICFRNRSCGRIKFATFSQRIPKKNFRVLIFP